MTVHEIDQMAQQVSERVASGRTVRARPPMRVPARELTIEFDAEPYPEVQAAFEEFCRMTGSGGALVGYRVRPVEDDVEPRARVSATVMVDAGVFVGQGVATDVVTGSVQAFADAVSRAS